MEEHDLSTSFLNLAKVDRDPVVEALAFNAEFVEFLDVSAISLGRLLSGRILSTYSEWKRLRPHIGVSRHQKVIDSVQKQTKALSFEDATESKAKRYFSQFMQLSPLKSSSLEPFRNRTVILAYFGSHDDIVDQTQKYLESNNIRTMLVDVECPSIDELQGYTESLLAKTDDILGSIVLYCKDASQIEDDSVEYAVASQDHLSRLLLISQLLTRRLNGPSCGKPCLFCGAVTFMGMSTDNGIDPVSASISSFWAVLRGSLNSGTIAKVIDFDIRENFSPSLLMCELLTEDRQGTIIMRGNRRLVQVLCLEKKESGPSDPSFELTPGSVVLAIGGGTGITARCVEGLVQQFGQLNIVLAGRTIPHLSHFWREISQQAGSQTRDDLFKAALLKIKQYGTDFDLNRIHKDLDAFYRSREILETMRRLEVAGGKVQYWHCDVGDLSSVRNLIDQCLHTFGKIDLLIYGAGVDRSQGFLAKDLQTFREVLHPKVVGGMNVLSLAAGAEGIKRVILFSSAYVWFGLEGSIDYVVGNRFLATAGEYWNRETNTQKISSIYWGPWADAGMAASDRLAAYFENWGIKMISPETGVKVFMEIVSKKPQDVCVLDPLPKLQYVSEVVAESAEAFEANMRLNESRANFPLLDRIMSYEPGLFMKAIKRFSSSNDRYLMDHVFDGSAVVPGVMGMELMAEAASFLTPELVVTELRDVVFQTPIQFTDKQDGTCQ
jgi:NAD(P)-dependent dehydrogenase (short-subunit alcohol dehydrogenase family)